MPKDVIITPASGLVDFYDAASNLDAKIQIDDVGNLSITNSGGVLSLGNTAANVFIGDGTNSVDIIFEQNGAIRALTGKTLTLGNSASSIAVQSPITINSPLLNTSTTGEFEVRQTVSSWTSTSHPLIKWSWNATYDDNLYLASGGNAAGTSQTALVISENSGILIGKASATPNATSVLSSTVATINASTGGISTLGVIISSGTGYRVATGVDAGGNLNLGRIDNVASLPYIDFNSGATTTDFDVRLQASGGNGTAGNGTLTVSGNLSLTGNLTVNGTTTTVNSTTVTIDDPIFTLGGDTAPGTDDNKDRGIEFRWHNGTTSKLGFFGFDDSTGYFTFIPDATNTSEVFSGTQGDIQATNFRGTLIGSISNSITFNNGGAGAASGSTYNGSAAVTVSNNTIGALSSSTTSTQSGYFGDIFLYDDSTPSHYLGITNSANLTAARTLSINVNDANRTVSLSGDLTVSAAATVSGTNTGDQTNITGNAGTVTNGVYTNTAQTISGVKTFSNGLIRGDTQGYPDYEFLLDFGEDVANTWRKLITVSSPIGQYITIGFKIEIVDSQGNHAQQASQNSIKEEIYYVACVRTNQTVQDTPDACYVTGPSSRIRAIKTSTGNYEIQIQNEVQYREYRGRISVYAVNGSHTVIFSNGTAVGTATATYTSTVNNAIFWVQRLGAKGQIISDVATGTAPFTVASTTLVTNLNADLLDGLNSSSANTVSTIVARDASGNFTAGVITATDFNSTSDVSLKENIKPAPGYDALSKINAVEFTWKSNGKKSYGVIAQELEQEMPELVSQDEDGIKTVSYTPLIAVLTNTVKEQQDRINRLEEIINTLLAKDK
jgi:hypothetical protein